MLNFHSFFYKYFIKIAYSKFLNNRVYSRRHKFHIAKKENKFGYVHHATLIQEYKTTKKKKNVISIRLSANLC